MMFAADILHFIEHPAHGWEWLHLALIFIVSLLAIYIFERIVAKLTPKADQAFTKRADSIITNENFVRVRRIETFIGLGFTTLRFLVVTAVVLLAWHYAGRGTSLVTTVGATAVFAVLANATLAPLLRDITYGAVMLLEHWYNVGDHIVIEPFAQAGGIVEKITLRSTKLRSVTGEAVWVHNQHMQAAKVTANGSHTLAIETFVNDPVLGRKIIRDAMEVVPTGPTTVPERPAISEVKEIRKGLWRITAVCQITPYREWLIDNYAIKAIKKTDEIEGKQTIVYGPLAFYADATAEKRFRRAVRIRRINRETTADDSNDEQDAASLPEDL